MPDINILINAKDNASGTLGKVSGAVDGVGKSAKGTSTQLSAMTVAMGTVVGNLATAGIGKLLELGSSLVTTGIEFDNMKQQAQIAFTTMLGDGERAKGFLDDLQQFAAKTPFEFPELLSASQRLLAMGFAADEVTPTLTAVGDAVAGLGGGGELVGRVTTALGQLQAKGKASAEELGQLTEAGIPAWEFLAKKIGVDIPTAMDMVSKGAVDADTAIGALVEGMNTKFGGLMEQQATTFGGLLSTIKDTFSQVSGTVMQPLFELISNGLANVVAWTSTPEFTAGVENLAGWIQDAADAVQALITGDFSGGLFGLSEDDPAVLAIAALRDGLEATGALIAGDVTTWGEKIGEAATKIDEALEPMREWFATEFPEAALASRIAIDQLNTALDDLLGSDTQDDFALTREQLGKFTGFLDDILSKSLAIAILRVGEFMANILEAVKFMDAIGDGDWKRAWEAVTNTQDRHTANMAAEALIWSGEMEAAMKLAGGNTVKGFGDGVDENESDATGAMESLSDSIQGTFTRALEIQSPSGIFKGYGKNIVQGLIDGINSMWTDLVSLAGSLADLFPEWMRDLLGIDSPSKVMFEIGKNTVAGFGFGFETGMAELVASMGGRVKTQMSELIDSFDPRNNGMVQAEDGSWVPKSFYASSNTPIRTPLSDLIDSFSPSVRGLIQAEDGSWVPKSFYAQPAPARNNTTIGDIYVTIAANGKVDEEAGRAAGRGIAEELRRRGFQ